MSKLDARNLYRLPWSYSDNVISWLEPTKKCNLYCEGCYSVNNPTSHKSLEEVRQDLEVFMRYRKTDAVSIAGGDPLTHPQLPDIVRMVADLGLKPIVNTNGHALTPELLRELKRQGLVGLTFHIDSGQRRPGWNGKSEIELNDLRLHYAQMAAAVGGLSTAFNSTVYEHTLPYVPDLVEWARRHIDIVHVMVFIAFRFAPPDMDYYVGGQRIEIGGLPYAKDRQQRFDISSPEILEAIRRRFPETEPAAYLNGTEDPGAMKWLLTVQIGCQDRVYGCLSPRMVELAQAGHHLWKGKYLGYVSPKVSARAKALLALALVDRSLRTTLGRYLRAVLRHPRRLFQPLHLQSIMIIQPADVLADGRQSMCDGCPDMTVWNEHLVWSCRLEELMRYGSFVQMVPAASRPREEGR
ncbi:MAG: radical SAM protein [Deinococcus sp.]|nr:radical SAM protein [Deinococcus sp.]